MKLGILNGFLPARAQAEGGGPRYGPADDFWYQEIGPRGAAGVRVTPATAMRLGVVAACVKVRAETIASLPVRVFQELPDGGKRKLDGHPLSQLLRFAPNEWQTSFEFREMLEAHLLLRGNAYSEIVANRRGRIEQLVPLHPDRVTVQRGPDGRAIYRHAPVNGEARVLTWNEVWHLRGLSFDGLTGITPLTAAAFGVAQAQQDYAARFWANDAQVSQVITYPGSFKDDESKKNFREAWQRQQTGSERHKMPVLEYGMDVKSLGLTNRDAQALDSRKYSDIDITRIYRVPPHKVGILDRATFSNIEHQEISFVVDCIRPEVVRFEQAIRRDLLAGSPDDVFAEFNLAGLLRGDVKSRYEAYALGRQWGWLSVNDILRLENMDPIGPAGDRRLEPMNMTPVSGGGADRAVVESLGFLRATIIGPGHMAANGHLIPMLPHPSTGSG